MQSEKMGEEYEYCASSLSMTPASGSASWTLDASKIDSPDYLYRISDIN